jgi:hypothetical protein
MAWVKEPGFDRLQLRMFEQWSGSPGVIGWEYQANVQLNVKPVIPFNSENTADAI